MDRLDGKYGRKKDVTILYINGVEQLLIHDYYIYTYQYIFLYGYKL